MTTIPWNAVARLFVSGKERTFGDLERCLKTWLKRSVEEQALARVESEVPVQTPRRSLDSSDLSWIAEQLAADGNPPL
jgi:hypothetical protein